MGFLPFFLILAIITSFCCCSLVIAQQPYARKATTNCARTDSSSSVLGYACNGLNSSCQSYVIFRSQSPFNTVSSISELLNSDPFQLSSINSVSETATLEHNQLVIVPVNCSCSGEYYQANTSYVIEHRNTYFSIANNTFQGLSTCHAIRNQNSKSGQNLYSGSRITVPLRCACVTKNQSDVGVKYLLSYIVTWGDSVSGISQVFGVETERTIEANGLSEQYFTIYPFTTLLIPLQNRPNRQFIKPPPRPPPPPFLHLSSSSKNQSNKTKIYVLVGVIAGSVILVLVGTILFCKVFHKKRDISLDASVIVSNNFKACEKLQEKKLEEESFGFLDSLSSIAQSLKIYNYEELQSATDNFSPSCWIKGSVYRGVINGDFAVIKKMNGDVSEEINFLKKINHSNIIRLSGVCFDDGHWYLVYEYAANGSLSDWIYSNNVDGKFLNWSQRIQIVLDVATGLNYLHSYTSPPYVHKDINSSNILLDSDFRAKITSFGSVRSVEGREGEFSLTNHIVGTRGFMAPEYLENGIVSTKLDVYAFGVLLLELLSGKNVADLYGGEKFQFQDVLNVLLLKEDGQERLKSLIDPSMQGKYPSELGVFLVELIHSCLHKNPADRPAMNEIVQLLSKILTTSLNLEYPVDVSGSH